MNSHQRLKLKIDASKILPFAGKIIYLLNITEEPEDDDALSIRLQGMNVVFSQQFLQETMYKAIVCALGHIAMYHVLNHDIRGKAYPLEIREIWGTASELARSSLLQHCFDSFIVSNFLTPRDFGFKEDLSAEEYMRLLLDLQKQDYNALAYQDDKLKFVYLPWVNEDADDFDEGSVITEGIFGNDTTDVIDEEKLDKAVLENAVLEAQRAFAKYIEGTLRGALSVNGEFRRFYYKFNPFHKYIMSNIRRLLLSLAEGKKGKACPTARPDRRTITPVVIPGKSRKAIHKVAAVVDVSGSTHSYHQEVFDALYLTVNSTDNLDIYIGDTTILQKNRRVRNPAQLKGLPMGGGTHMDVILKEVDDMGLYKYIVLISDGETDWPDSLRAQTFYLPIGTKQKCPDWITTLV